MIVVMAALSFIFFGAGLFFVDDVFAYAKGIIFGTLFAVLKLVLLERTLSKSVDMPKGNAQNYARLHYTLRYFLTIVVLAVAAIEPSISLLGVVLSLITMRPAAYIVSRMKDVNNSD